MICSCIDRIYITSPIFNTASDWEINNSPIEHGHWKLPLFLLKDKAFKNEIRKLPLDLNKKIMSAPARSHTNNPQIIFKTFKDKIKELAIDTAKIVIPKLTKKLIQLKQEHKAIINNNSLNEHEKMAQTGPIHDQIDQLEKKKFQKAKNSTKTRFTLEGETISKYWSLLNKENKPWDPIFSLWKPGSDPPRYETNSHHMAEIARKHHENLLTEGIHPDDAEREAAIIQVLDDINESSYLPPPDNDKLSAPITEDLIQLALQESATNTTPGINGLPYELWKMLAMDHTEEENKDKNTHNQHQQPIPDLNEPIIKEIQPAAKKTRILETLTKVYLDIECHGVHDDSEFAAGWLCPLYKKKDKREIGNYRPITLLNTDYKIYTKALAIKLAAAAPHIVHPNQAGFMPGCSIHDQVKLAKLMIHYVEVSEENGLIVALDQEKAYDKICHDYLWCTMQKYNIPQSFTNTVRSLYESAKTAVILNGAISKTFQVSRGVH